MLVEQHRTPTQIILMSCHQSFIVFQPGQHKEPVTNDEHYLPFLCLKKIHSRLASSKVSTPNSQSTLEVNTCAQGQLHPFLWGHTPQSHLLLPTLSCLQAGKHHLDDHKQAQEVMMENTKNTMGQGTVPTVHAQNGKKRRQRASSHTNTQ